MSTHDPNRGLAAKYEGVARRYLQSQSERTLYQAGLLGRELLEQQVGPTEVIQMHLAARKRLLGEAEFHRSENILDHLGAVLLEVMMVYGESHQQVKDVLAELQTRYAELDRTKSELEQSRDELREKTAQLIQNTKMIALGELCSGAAHEINQPLNAMMIIHQDVLRDIKKDRLDVERLEKSLETAVDQARRVAEIVDHMRLFTRKTTGARRETVEFKDPIDGVLLLIGQQLLLRGIEVRKELGEALQISGDCVRLEQVFMNLLTNARDAVLQNQSDKAKTILLKTYRVPGDHVDPPSVAFEITDNGPGISEELHDRIFDPFFTTKPIGEGTGLGLSVTNEIVREHGGRIEVESKAGEGTTFKVLLPALNTKGQKGAAPRAP